MQDEFNLQQYDFVARYYDPAIARWNSPDPLADLAADWTPFRYGFNNPMTYSDPSGMAETTWDGKTVASGTVTPFVWKPSGDLKTGVDGAKISSSGSKPPSSGGMQAPGQMASINITSLKLPPVASPDLMGPGIQAVTCGTPSAPETVSEYEPTTWDMLYNLGENMRYSGDYLGGFASDATYNMVNDAYTGYNLVVNKRYTDLRGVQVGYTKAVRCATFNWASILSLPLGWMGEAGEAGSIAQEGGEIKSLGAAARGFSKKNIPEGFKEVKQFGYQHGQKVYEYMGKYFSRDVDGHNGGVWKVFEVVNGKLKRIGTADEFLNIFKN